MKKIYVILAILFIGLTTAGCASKDNPKATEADKLLVYTSIYPIQYAVERIGGDTLTTETVYPPGVDEHSYELTSKDMTAIANGDAFIYLGAGLEALAEKASDALGTQDVLLIELGQHEELFHANDGESHEEEQTEDSDEDHDGHDHGNVDPHIWLDPLRMIALSDIIKEELIALNPNDEATYNENFNALEADLLALDQQFTDLLASKENKHIIVSHAAYGYWEERYGIEQIAINGISSSSEPSQKELTEIIDLAEQYQLNYVIHEQNSSNRVTDIIQAEISAEPLMIHNLSVLTEEDINQNEDYISLMTYNLSILDQATH